MRPQVKWLLTTLLAVLIVAPVAGQLPLGAELESLLENGVGEPILLANDSVKQEINLTGEQSDRVQKIVKEVSDKYRSELQKAGGDRKKQLRMASEWMRETRERVHKALPDILKPEQMKRLDQIQIQVNGIASFKRPDVQKKLNLTEEQKVEIRKIGDHLKQEAAETFKEAAKAPLRKMPGAVQKVRELKEDATKKAIQTLTAEQKKTWKEITGEKIDFKLELPLRPGGRP
ncbi:MAG TPA: hypothetical protein VMF69_24630 [Gemmataceae bacterium]|nr:hypothetical protein [Gemmataceae bacterium]